MAKRSASASSVVSSGGGGPPGIVVFCGPDVFQQAEAIRQLREELESGAGAGGLEVVRFDGATCLPADVLDECRSMGLMQQRKLVVLESAEKVVAEEWRPMFERYARSPAEGVTLVLRSANWRAGNLDKLIVAGGGVIRKFEELAPGKAAGWAVARCAKRHGATLTEAAAVALVERVGADLGRISAELGKLAAAAGEGEPIGPELVGAFVGRSREEAVWAIQGALASGDGEAALGAVRDAMEVQRHAAQLVWYAIADAARKTHAVARLAAQGESAYAAATRTRIWPEETKRAVVRCAERLGPERARALFRECVEADLAVKTGLARQEHAVERLALGFAAAAGGGRGGARAV